MRQAELAVRLGYEQSYLSALEVGKKGPPTSEFVGRLIQLFELDSAEQAALLTSVKESQRRYVVPDGSTTELFKMMNELWGALDTLHPGQITLIRHVIALGGQISRSSRGTGRDLQRKPEEAAQM